MGEGEVSSWCQVGSAHVLNKPSRLNLKKGGLSQNGTKQKANMAPKMYLLQIDVIDLNFRKIILNYKVVINNYKIDCFHVYQSLEAPFKMFPW